jgi:hypothetical protein
VNQISNIDPDVKIPAAVRAAAARSDEIVKAMKAAQNPAPEDVTSEGNTEVPPELNAQSLAEPAPEPTQEATSAPEPAHEESWEHKYKSVNGRYIRAQEQIRGLTEQIQNLQNVVATMQVQQPVQDAPELKAERLITEDEERDYGSDLLNVVGKKAREELTPVIKQYEAKIKELEQKLQGINGVVTQDAQSKMLSSLDERLPQWRELNYNEEFLNWLALPDPYSGVIRHDMLKAAYAQSSASRVLAFFNGFLAEEAAVAPAPEPDIGETKVVPKVPLQNFAAPGRAKTAAASTPAEKPIFTRAQIAAFYADVAANKYKGRDEAKNKLEAQIFDAQREGRIR